jgi:uncharacterized repeat protein (TIGR03806 family)
MMHTNMKPGKIRKTYARQLSLMTAWSLLAIILSATIKKEKAPAAKLSEYGFFVGPMADLKPATDLVPYALNTPLFTDYAEKARFLRLPEGKKAVYNDSTVFVFPQGTTLIKNFYYPLDMRDMSKGREIIETRLLILEEKGWKALPYIWNKEQTDAFLDVAGETRQVRYLDANGKSRQHAYIVPNLNQCKGCHNRSELMEPIGPSARQLNGLAEIEGKKQDQLDYWASHGLIDGLPEKSSRPLGVVWNDPGTGTLDQRARAWLDINCGHCHRRGGPASSSGLYLDIHEQDPLKLGVGKTPVAAGRGSGNLQVSIYPGQPDKSIMIYRMQSTDPGVMMPELGRSMNHSEGIALIRSWIKEMKN